MAYFPPNARNGQTHKKFGRRFAYSETTESWTPVSTLASVAEVRVAEQAVEANNTTTYATAVELPLVGNTAGAMAFVQETNRLYLWSGTGWYNVATVTSAAASVSSAASAYTLATDGTPTVLTLTQSGLESPTWSYAVTSGSLGRTATVSQAANVFTITPSTSPRNVGSFGLTFKATDGSNTIVKTAQFTMSNTAPVIGIDPNPSYTLNSDGTPSIVTLAATDAEGHSITWSYEIVSGSLEDTTITNVGEVFTVTPGTSPAVFSLKFIASDSALFDESTTASFILEFVAADTTYINNQMVVRASSTVSVDPLTSITTDDRTNSRTLQMGRVGAVDNSTSGLGSVSPYYPGSYSYHTFGDGFTIQRSVISDYSRLYPGTGDFTFECWYIDATPHNNDGGIILFNLSNIIVVKNLQNNLTLSTGINGSSLIVEAGNGSVPTTKVWNHYAVSRQSGTVRLFLNGVLLNSATNTTNYRRTLGDGHGITGAYNGGTSKYITDMRWVVGTAVYTSSFNVPTSPLEKIAGTQFLLSAKDNTRTDQYDGTAIGKSGDDAGMAMAFSPYSPTAEYDPAIHSGSVHIDSYSTSQYVWLRSSDTDIAIGTQDYSVECWVYFQHSNISAQNPSPIIFCLASNQFNGTNRNVISLGYDGGAFCNQSGFYSTSATPSRSLNAVKYAEVLAQTYGKWYHFAVCRHNGTRTLYVNGVARSSEVDTYDFSQPMQLRLFKDNSISAWQPFSGYMSDFRVVVGNSVYTADFTPPTQRLTEVPGTEVLLNFNNGGIVDTTGMQNLRGTAVASNSITKYDDYSMYFDGNTFLGSTWVNGGEWRSNEFTIEAWIYPLSVSGLQVAVGGSGASAPRLVINGALAEMRLGQNTIVASGGSVAANEWTHIAASRVGNTTRVFVNGVVVGSSSATHNFLAAGIHYQSMTIGGTTAANLGVSNGFNGYIESPRFKLGTGKYSSNFTPPTAPLGWSNAE
jgi:hypothetical protein